VNPQFFEKKVVPVIEILLADLGNQMAVKPVMSVGESGLPGKQLDFSVKMIASKLGASSGSDVLKAGIVSLALVHGKPQFSRREILSESQKATGYWKKSITNNASKYLDTLLSLGFIVEASNGYLSLSAAGEAEATKLLQ
jgi:hypothetical protein